MKVLIITIGTRGDVQPLLALAKGLQRAGHTSTLCTCAQFQSFVESHGVTYAHMNNELIEFMHSDDGKTAMENTASLWQAVVTGVRLIPTLRTMLQRQIDDAWAACESSKPDLILYHPKAIGAPSFAEHLGIPCILAAFVPLFEPSGELRAMGFHRGSLGRWYNRAAYWLIQQASWLSAKKPVNAWRQQNGLTAATARSISFRSNGQRIPVLHGFSESIIKRPADWPRSASISGFWILSDKSVWQPPTDLVAFLNNGAPPVYIGFGSIFGKNPNRLTRRVIDAILSIGARAIIVTGWGGLSTDKITLPASVFAIESVPHEWLFPQVCTVIHHGGAGTTAAALRAGRPQVICPFFGDQGFWGDQIHSIGCGPKPIQQKKLHSANLAAAVRQTIDDTNMRNRAAAVATEVNQQDGIGNAVRFIEAWSH